MLHPVAAHPIRGASIAILLALPVVAAAQGAPAVPGARIRVTVRGDTTGAHVGTLVAVRADSLTFRPAGDTAVRAVATDRVAKLEMSRGMHRHTLDGLVIGAASGAAVGIVLGLASGNDPQGGFLRFTAGDKAAILGAGFGTIGLVTGAIIGATKRSERWVPAALQPVGFWLTPSRAGGRRVLQAGIRLTIAARGER